MIRDFEAAPVNPAAFIFDLVYCKAGDPPPAIVGWAKDQGMATIDGLEMLLHQGAESFRLWTKKAMDLDVARQALD